MYMADLAVSYPDLSSKRENASRAIWGHLYAACDPLKKDWYLNHERIRMAISPNLVDHVVFGATGSEGANAEIRRRFPGVVQIRASVLRPAVRVFHLCNMRAF